MERLGRLWIEMFQYEELPEAPEQAQVLVIPDESQRALAEEAAGMLSAGKNWQIRVTGRLPESVKRDIRVRYWVLAEEQEAAKAFVPSEVNSVIYPRIYGLTEEECRCYPEYEEYRRAFVPGERYISAGEWLCRLFAGIGAEKAAGKRIRLWAEDISLDDGTYMAWKTVWHAGEFFYFDNTYGGRLEKLQECQLACLDEFDRICKAHDISYFLGGGTLLGAVRHQRVIPWDDDIDVMMLRDQYERFLAVVQQEIGLDFHFQSNKTDPDYHSVFDKIRMEGTVFKTEFSRRFSGMHQGIFIDIFVHDRTAKHTWGQKLHVFATLFARSMVFHKWEGTDMHFYGKYQRLCRIMTWYKNRNPIKKLERLQYKVITHFNRRRTGWLYDGTGEHLRRGAFPESWLSGTRMGVLNGKPYPIPLEAEKYLAYSYGEDYMQLPPPQKRKAAHPVVELRLPDGMDEKQDRGRIKSALSDIE